MFEYLPMPVFLRIFSLIVFIVLPAFADSSSLCLAHRGEHIKHGENSLEGIQEALSLGADGVELDLRHTLDGVAVGVHDIILWRVAQSKGGHDCKLFTPISSLKFSEIRENCELDKLHEQIPNLQEILALLKDKNALVMLQLKDNPSEATAELIGSFPQKDNLRIHSLWESALHRFSELSEPHAFQIKTLIISKWWFRLSENYGNDIWWFFRWVLSWKPELLDRETGLFSVDTEDALVKARALKVNFITTDNPNICKHIQTDR